MARLGMRQTLMPSLHAVNTLSFVKQAIHDRIVSQTGTGLAMVDQRTLLFIRPVARRAR
jgi:hypothetical protein